MQVTEKFKKHFILDIESDGPHPMDYNMISFGLVNLFDPSYGFLGQVKPIHDNDGGIPEARAISGVTWDHQKDFFFDPEDEMKKAETWLHSVSDSDHVVIWTDNPAFDWQFWNAYCHRFLGKNPAGFSARRIGDLFAGSKKNIFNTNSWKKFRQTKHTHNPEDDARGNVEALRKIIESF